MPWCVYQVWCIYGYQVGVVRVTCTGNPKINFRKLEKCISDPHHEVLYTLLLTKCADCPQGWKLENLVARQEPPRVVASRLGDTLITHSALLIRSVGLAIEVARANGKPIAHNEQPTHGATSFF